MGINYVIIRTYKTSLPLVYCVISTVISKNVIRKRSRRFQSPRHGGKNGRLCGWIEHFPEVIWMQDAGTVSRPVLLFF